MFKNLLGFGYEAIFQPNRDLRAVSPSQDNIKPIDLQAAGIKFFGLNKLFETKQKTK